MAWSTFASCQMSGPFYGACCLGNRAQLLQSSGTSSAGEAVSLEKSDKFWLPRKWCNRHEPESLIGHLHHAAKVVWPGRTFLHHMIDLLCCFRRRDHPVCLNREFHIDLLWWHQFLEDWHGISFWLFPGLLPEADVEVSSDAAANFG